jgi:hypothetical protein
MDPRGSNRNALPNAFRVAAEMWTRPGKPIGFHSLGGIYGVTRTMIADMITKIAQ